MEDTLVAWIGRTDLNASEANAEAADGPIARAVVSRGFRRVELLSDYPAGASGAYVQWLERTAATRTTLHPVELSSPTNYHEIYERAVEVLAKICSEATGGPPPLVFHLSPGTPAMAAIWLLLAKTRFPARLIQSSPQRGVEDVVVPFDISVDFLPELLRKPDEELVRLTQGLPPEAPELSAIVHRSASMKRLVALARRVALRNVPVLLQGESGTGKELFARAIHHSNPWRRGRFVPVNCGAIPADLIESELFGHERGSFTGAERQRIGLFETAQRGTLFLDEIGELPRIAQVKLLRALQERQITRVGGTSPIPVDIRVIAATNRNLIDEMAGGRFRGDLFHRVAVALLQLPPLRERREDLPLLLDRLLERVNAEFKDDPGYEHKKLSARARKLLAAHDWPGNIRELENTLRRAAVWSTGPLIDVREAKEALLPLPPAARPGILDRPLGHGLSLPGLLAEVARHYLERAMDEAKDNKTRAAELVGLPSYQTLTNWLKKYGIEDGMYRSSEKNP